LNKYRNEIPPTVAYVVWYKIGGLDGILPVFKQLRQEYPTIKLNILIAELNKAQVIRNSRFYVNLSKELEIELLDLIDLIPNWAKLFSPFFRWVARNPIMDTGKKKYWNEFLLYHINKWVLSHLEAKRLLSFLQSDIVLLNEIWFEKLRILDWLLKAKSTTTKFFVVTHGPVFLKHPDQNVDVAVEVEKDAFQMYMRYNFSTPAGVGLQYWNDREVIPYHGSHEISLRSLGIDAKEGWLNLERWTYVGYPAFDSSWFSYIDLIMKTHTLFRSILPDKRRKIRCLFLIRVVSFEDNHLWRTTVDEFRLIVPILSSLTKTHDLEVILKPHPNQNLGILKALLSESDDEHIHIVQESIISVLPSVDFAITVHSSGSYFAMIWGIPTIHLVKPDSYKDFPKLFYEMETNVYRTIWGLNQLYSACAQLMDELVNGNPVPNDVEHMRKFYPDGSIELVMEQLRPYLEGDSN